MQLTPLIFVNAALFPYGNISWLSIFWRCLEMFYRTSVIQPLRTSKVLILLDVAKTGFDPPGNTHAIIGVDLCFTRSF